ncbi:hypothetical protein GGI07_000339 [Coemansia sp. Benny D115]|nr:hypothetical protein GGI07_000339 [Coemansia sp. Benny D115]
MLQRHICEVHSLTIHAYQLAYWTFEAKLDTDHFMTGIQCNICTGASGSDLCHEHKAQVHKIRGQIKAMIVSRQTILLPLSAEARVTIGSLELICSACPECYKFAKGIMYYESKANPDRHLKK